VTIHVYPVNDVVEHDVDGGACICGPDFEYSDPRDGITYDNGPLVLHHSLDGRELSE
jgi:hypothetical protein